MANSTTVQILVDGPRNVVVKLDGIVDTSDIAATGTLGTGASGATTTGSTVLTFTAGGLAPVVGQYVTGTGIPAGAYIKSIDSTTQVTLNTAATATNTGLTFTLVAGNVVLIDPAQLSALNFQGTTPTKLIVDKISYNIEAGIAVNTYWDATTPVLLASLVSSGDDLEFKKFGGLYSNAGAGVTGRIVYNTQGWSAGAILSFNVIFECRKNY